MKTKCASRQMTSRADGGVGVESKILARPLTGECGNNLWPLFMSSGTTVLTYTSDLHPVRDNSPGLAGFNVVHTIVQVVRNIITNFVAMFWLLFFSM